MDTEQEIQDLNTKIENLSNTLNSLINKDDALEYRMNNHKHNNHDGTQRLSPFQSLSVFSGSSLTKAFVGGTIFNHYVNAGNGTTLETDLYSDTLPANILINNGDRIEVECGGVFVSSGTATRQVKLYFGGTAIFDTGALTLSLSSAWTMYASIIRVSATVVRYMISFTTEGAALAAYTAVGELTGLTLSSANIIKVTGQAAGVGAATNDIVAKLGIISWYPTS